MSLLPKPYVPTTEAEQISNRHTIDFINGTGSGYTYTSGLIWGPPATFQTPGNSNGITTGPESRDIYKTLNRLNPGKQALLAWDDRFSGKLFQFLPDSLTGSFGTRTFYNTDWSNTTSTNYISPWPDVGISMIHNYWKTWLSGNTGLDIKCVSLDQEGQIFGDTSLAVRTAIANHPNYALPWRGLTSFKELYEYYGGTTGSITASNYVSYAYNYVTYIYTDWAYKCAFSDAVTSVFPNAVFGNYMSYPRKADPPVNVDKTTNTFQEDGWFVPYGDISGNGVTPVCYGLLRQADCEMASGVRISSTNPTRVFRQSGWDDQFNAPMKWQNYFTTGAWSSFLMDYGMLREAVREVRERNIPNTYLFPYIADVAFDNAYHLKYLIYPVTTGQTPAEILHNSWYFDNISSITGGFTAYDGSTSGYELKTPSLGITGGPTASYGGIWYRYNISDISYDSGITNQFKISTIGSTGSTCAVALYLYNIQNGVTYNFSYYIDLDRGFTGSFGRIIKGWSTSDTNTLAPERPTASTTFSGLSLKQLLPVDGITTYNQIAPIFYNSGDSGWTKVSWRFVGDSSSTVGLHIYYGPNSSTVTGGYNIYLKQPELQIEGSSAIYINPIDNEYAPSNAYSSFRYYYNGLSAGLTYNFSYYIDLSKGFTQTGSKLPTAQQVIEHSHVRGYGRGVGPRFGGTFPTVSRGITFTQISPVISGSCFNSSPIGYSAGSSSWTKVSFAFMLNDIPQEPLNNQTFAGSLYTVQNYYSIMGNTSSLIGYTAYLSNPSLEIEGVSGNISVVTPRKFDDNYRYYMWREGPPGSYTDTYQGMNSSKAAYYQLRGGNSAYYYEFLRHACLLGTKQFAWYSGGLFLDYSLPGVISPDMDRNLSSVSVSRSLRAGYTGYYKYMTDLNVCFEDIHNKIGGFTTTTADYSELNYLSPYVTTGMPGPNGITWWWRLTVKPGYTLYCNGQTLSAATNNVGMWLGTTGPTLAGINISTEFWGYKKEVGITPATKDIDFTTMSTTSDLTSLGFTFTRGSTATYINSSGKVVVVGPNTPRFNHNQYTLEPRGLLLENAGSNYLNWSESFATSGGAQNNWIDSGITRISGNTSPGLSNNAIRFIAENSNGTIISSAAAPGIQYTSLSFWARGVTGNEMLYYTINGGTSWNLVSGLSTGWYRYSYGPTAGSIITGFKLGNTGNAVELWGAQLEPRRNSSPAWSEAVNEISSSYIPTGNTGEIRSLERCSLVGTGFTSWYGGTYGTFCFEKEDWILPTFLESSSFIDFFDANLFAWNWGFQRSIFYIGGATRGDTISLYDSSSGTITQSFNSWPLNIPTKIVTSYSPTGIKFATHRSIYGSPHAIGKGLPKPATRMLLLLPESENSGYNGHMRRFRWWNYVMTDVEMLKLSSTTVNPYWMNLWDTPGDIITSLS